MFKRFVRINKLLIAEFVIIVVLSVMIVLMENRIRADGRFYGITYLEAAKIIAFSCADNPDDMGLDENWRQNLTDYVNINGYMEISDYNDEVRYCDVYRLCCKLDVPGDCLMKFNIPDISLMEDSRSRISKDTFIKIYGQILEYMPCADSISKVNIGIAGTGEDISDLGEWESATSDGIYGNIGLNMDAYIDKNISAYVRNSEIICVEKVRDNNVTYKNVYISGYNNGKLSVNIYGAVRTFSVRGVSDEVANCFCDINVKRGHLKEINKKTDTISGRVLSINDDSIEVEGYGIVPVDDDFVIYEDINKVHAKNYSDIIVGYDLQDFIVADGKICGAVINRTLEASNIRVIIKTTGFSELFHENVVLSCDCGMNIKYDDKEEFINAGEKLIIGYEDERIVNGRMTINSAGNDEIMINSIVRSYGNPLYKGTIEIAKYDEGLIIVNDIDIEEYLKKVVPSEMPSSFNLEALKCQAVCARSYAYMELSNDNYGRFGANVDDSIQYQVYNNSKEKESTNKAIDETRGEVVTYNGSPVKTYYYSTSCGSTTDVSLWGSSRDNYPYFSVATVSSDGKNADLTDEDNFNSFIKSTNVSDYDYGCTLYRWSLTESISQISDCFNGYLSECYYNNPPAFLKMKKDGSYESVPVSSVGDINDIEVMKRTSGGAVISIRVTGSEATVMINSESAIRMLLGNGSVDMQTMGGEDRYSNLPSTFFVIDKLYDNGRLSGFKITGGGYGHGIGMSQNAANKMAETMNYKQIINFFYNDTQVKNKSEL